MSAELMRLLNSNLQYVNYLLELEQNKSNDRLLKDKIYLLELKAKINEESNKEYTNNM